MSAEQFHKLKIHFTSAIYGKVFLDNKEIVGVRGIKLNWSVEDIVEVELKLMISKGDIEVNDMCLKSDDAPLKEHKQKRADDIAGRTWHTPIDDKTCVYCKNMDGAVLDKDFDLAPPLKECENPGGCRCYLGEKPTKEEDND